MKPHPLLKDYLHQAAEATSRERLDMILEDAAHQPYSKLSIQDYSVLFWYIMSIDTRRRHV